jgi:hypothetical protein
MHSLKAVRSEFIQGMWLRVVAWEVGTEVSMVYIASIFKVPWRLKPERRRNSLFLHSSFSLYYFFFLVVIITSYYDIFLIYLSDNLLSNEEHDISGRAGWPRNRDSIPGMGKSLLSSSQCPGPPKLLLSGYLKAFSTGVKWSGPLILVSKTETPGAIRLLPHTPSWSGVY